MKFAINIVIAGFYVFLISCTEQTQVIETNSIFHTLIKHQQDSLEIFFGTVDSAGTQKIKKHVSYKNQPDSIAIYYKSVDTLRFKKPLTAELLKKHAFTFGNNIDTLFTEGDLAHWNEDISNYKARKWTQKESENLPVITKNHQEIKTLKKQKGKLKSLFYYSIPFFNEKENKTLIYQDKISKSSQIRQLYILNKTGNDWSIVYRTTLFISTN